jgi:hypothetical protein
MLLEEEPAESANHPLQFTIRPSALIRDGANQEFGMSTATQVATERERSSTQRVSAGEILLLCCSVVSLLLSCILWSPHKQIWMDEIFTWREVSDRSLWHLCYAIQHGADGGMPLFYTTAWLWAKAFGTGVLTLRL